MEDKDKIEALCFYETKCKVDNSPHRAEIERLKLEGKSFRDIIKIAQEQWNETYTLSGMSNHFKKHVLPFILAQSRATRQTKEYADRKLKNSMDYLEKLEFNLNILERGVDLLVSKGLDEPNKVKMLSMLMTEIRKTIESIAGLRHSLDLTTPAEHADNVKTLLTILRKLDLNETQLLALQELMKQEGGIIGEEPNKPSNTV